MGTGDFSETDYRRARRRNVRVYDECVAQQQRATVRVYICASALGGIQDENEVCKEERMQV